MPPKKAEEVKKIPLGRPGNSLKLGIIGVPNLFPAPHISHTQEGAIGDLLANRARAATLIAVYFPN